MLTHLTTFFYGKARLAGISPDRDSTITQTLKKIKYFSTNTKPESKFEDVPEEVLTDPTMRTALGMDPIPGMNTPVDDNKETLANGMKIFKHPQFGNLTVIQKEDNKLWFIGKEVAEKLGYKNVRDAIYKHVDNDDKGVANRDTLGGTQKMTIINESGLYSLILSSKLPSAKEFKHWVTSEVLPSIRKNGAYIRNQENMTPEQLVAAGLIAAQKIIEERLDHSTQPLFILTYSH